MSNLPDIHDHVQVVIEKSDLTTDDDISRRWSAFDIAEQIRREAQEMNKMSAIFFEIFFSSKDSNNFP